MYAPITGDRHLIAASPSGYILPADVTQFPGTNFATWSYSEAGGLAFGPALLPDAGYLAINGTTDLSGIVQACRGGVNVTSIRVVANRQYQFYQYAIVVYGQGPADAVPGGSLGLLFTDQTGETHGLTLRAAMPQWYFVQYNARHPGIVRMQWSSAGGLSQPVPGAADMYP